MFDILLKGVLGSYPKTKLSLNFIQICDGIDFWAFAPMLISEATVLLPTYIIEKKLSLKVVEYNLDAKPTALH